MAKNKIHSFKYISLILSFVLIFINLNMVNTKALDYVEVKSDWTLQYDLNVNAVSVKSGVFDSNYYTLITKYFYQEGGTSLFRGNNNTINGSMTITEGQVQVYGNLTINGNLNISGGSMILNGANLIVKGNVNINGGELDLGKGNVYINTSVGNYDGNMNFSNGKVDVNGANLNIEGDLVQNGGTFDGVNTIGSLLYVNGGNVSVGKNYTLIDFSKLKMENPKDFILVKGDFFFSTYSPHKDLLKDGVLEVKGTFQQKNFNTKVKVAGQDLVLTQKNNFMPMLNHKVVLSGTQKQSVSFDSDNACQFNILEVKNNLLTDYYMYNVKWNKLIESSRASDNVDLVNITINGQNIKITDPKATNYGLTLSSNTSDALLNVLAEPYNKSATISIEGNRLVNKAALVKITVTAEDKITKRTYFVNVQLKDSEIYSIFKDIKTADYHSLALRNDGVLFGFGTNNFGQLGDGSTTSNIKLTQVKNLSNVIDFDTSNSHSIALTSDGSVWVWGLNDYGQLSESAGGDLLNPVKVSELRDIVKVQAGNRYNLALDRTGFVWMWGYNNSGQFGDEEESYNLKPTLVGGFSAKIKDIAAGDFHCLALSTEGKVYAWGANDYGQIGDGTLNSKYSPIEIPSLYGVKSIAAEGNTSSCIKEDGTALFWGESKFYTQDNIKVPESIKDLTDIISIKINSDHMVLLKKDGQSFSLGNNNFGQLGDGTYSNRNSFIQLKGLSKISKISVGTYNTFALTEEGYIYGLGRNNLGQLGINETGGTYNQPQRLYGFDAGSVDRVYANYNPGEIDKYTNIRLYTNTSGASIYYTLDGTDPTEKSTLYSSPINITEHTIIKAVAIRYGKYSAVSTFEYYISNKPKVEMNVNIGSKAVQSGAIVELPITFTNVPTTKGISNLKFAISYNPEIMELQTITPGSDLVKESKDFSYSKISNDTILLTFEDGSKVSRNITKNGTFATLKFYVKYNAPSGRYSVARQANTSEGFYYSIYNPINVYYNGGYVDINTLLYGDVNGDGKVTALDLQYVQRYVEKKISYFPWYKGAEAADVDRDGSITSRDVELIKKIILNQ